MTSHAILHRLAVFLMVAAITVTVASAEKTMFAKSTGWGGGNILLPSIAVTTGDETSALHDASPLHSSASLQDPEKTNPLLQLSLALGLIVVGYTLEIIRQEYALHVRRSTRKKFVLR